MRSRTILVLILAGIFFTSLAFSFYYRISPTTDAKAYTRIARNLAAGLGYIEHYENGIYVIGEGGTAEYIHGRLEVGGYGSKRILEDVRKVQSNPPAVCKVKIPA